MKRKKTKNFNYACPREFITGRWRVHLVYPGEPRMDGGLPKSENENPPAVTRRSSSTIPVTTDSS